MEAYKMGKDVNVPTELEELMHDPEFIDALINKKPKAKRMVEKAKEKEKFYQFIYKCRMYSKNNEEKCRACNLRFLCYTV